MSTSYLDKEVTQAIKVLSSDGVVAFPTDTLYALGGDPHSKKAIERIYAVKGRSTNKALPLLIANTDFLSKFAVNPPPFSIELTKHFWPGPLTLILNASKFVPNQITSGSGKVALRVPNHFIAQRLAYECNGAITGTSANISGATNPLNADGVRNMLGDTIDYVIDGGTCSTDLASTILDLTTSPPTVVRMGAITKNDMETILGNNALKGWKF